MSKFTHLHCHTQYSLLDGAAKIHDLIEQTKLLGMSALAITDHGNLFGVPHFVAAAQKQGIKPIIGCEFYVAPDRHDRKDKTRFHQLLLAKNEVGYQNLIELCSISYTEGYYYKPRIDQKIISQHAEGLIATTCCLAAQVPQAILHQGEAAAEKIFRSWLDIFGREGYYIELQRHNIPEQNKCNKVLCKWAKKYNVKIIATNDVHYIKQEDHLAQDILLCLQTGKDYNDPKRMRFENDQFFLKSPQQMAKLFKDLPQALANTTEIVDKVQDLDLTRDILLPIFQIPPNFPTQDAYLAHLTMQGAQQRYQTLSPHLLERIHYELKVIKNMGFAGYFLIIQDLIQAAKKRNVAVGPGRGSVAGSMVAYALGITDIDPIHYNLFFERFLNPDRVSQPDIDIDFDDVGRQKVIDYVIEKYGKDQVAQIITFGSMAARSAIKDVARVLGLPLQKAIYLANLVPEKPGTTLAQAFVQVPELAAFTKPSEAPEHRVISLATTLEGVARHTGIHAAGIIIAPDKLTKYVPVKTDKETNLLVTQYDGSVIEQVGMLKMDLLGLKTLSIREDALKLIAKNKNKIIDINTIPLNDEKTFRLFQQAATTAIFQFESEGMKKWLPKLKPTDLEDLIAMNALYRPGPMQFIPNFIDRKHGKEKIIYPHPVLEKILKPTYGIIVYQEQIMQTAQLIAGYTLAQADMLRRVMGKKKEKEMAQQRAIFVKGAQKKQGLNEKEALEIFEGSMVKFARYGFNRSHSVAYAVIAYQTAFLKANYCAEYMAAALTHNQQDTVKIASLVEECRRLGVQVQGPDINESQLYFSPNTQGQIRFGLSAIKGVGSAAVRAIMKEREEKGPFKDLMDFCKRMIGHKVNKRAVESFAMAGAFDSFTAYHRRQYLYTEEGEDSWIEHVLKYAQKWHKSENDRQQSLFATTSKVPYDTSPEPPSCTPYNALEQLSLEKQVLGFYTSGHPLDAFQLALKTFCNAHTQNVLTFKDREARIAGIVTDFTKRQTKTGRYFGRFTLEDYKGSLSISLFGEDFKKYAHLLEKGELLYIKGSVQARYYQQDVLEFRPKSMELLDEITAKYTQRVQLTIDVQTLTPVLIENLYKAVQTHSGKCALHVQLIDPVGKMAVPTLSRTYRIAPTSGFFVALDALQGVGYSLAGG